MAVLKAQESTSNKTRAGRIQAFLTSYQVDGTALNKPKLVSCSVRWA